MESSGTLLVVDDDPGVRALLAEYLGGHRYDVRTADSGDAMRAEIERALPDAHPARHPPARRGRADARALPARALRRRHHHGHGVGRRRRPRRRARGRRRRLRRQALRPARAARAREERAAPDAGASRSRRRAAGGGRRNAGARAVRPLRGRPRLAPAVRRRGRRRGTADDGDGVRPACACSSPTRTACCRATSC